MPAHKATNWGEKHLLPPFSKLTNAHHTFASIARMPGHQFCSLPISSIQ